MLRRIALYVFVTVAAVCGAFGIVSAEPPRVSIYVFTATDPSGLADRDQKDRTATVAYLMEQFGKAKQLVPAASCATAVICVEITRSAEQHVFTNNMVDFRYAILTVGAYHVELSARQSPVGRGLRTVIEDWVKLNRPMLEVK